MSVNQKVISVWLITSTLLLGLSGWLAYKLIDKSVTLDHYTQHTMLIQKQRDLLLEVVNSTLSSKSEVHIRELLKSLSVQTSNFQKEEGHLVVNQISFFFRDGKLINISAK